MVVEEPRPGFNVFGEKVTISCAAGYALSLKINEFVCQEDGTWSNQFSSAECLPSQLKNVKILIQFQDTTVRLLNSKHFKELYYFVY